MTLSTVKQTFLVRYYYWAASEFKREISEAFPTLSLFNTGPDHSVLQFMLHLDSASRSSLAAGLLKRFHPKAISALGEEMSVDEKHLLSRLDDFRLIEDAKSISKSMISGGSNLVSKSRLRGMILHKFKAALGEQCFGLELVGLDPELDFKMKLCGWTLNTHFEFNGKHRQIHYWHDIVSPTVIEPHRAPAIIIGQFISFNAWLGISSQTQWEYLKDYDAEAACDAAIKLCELFFEVAPKLFKGLEFENITQP